MTYPTNPIYKLVKDLTTGVVNQVKIQPTSNSEKIIPFNKENTDYQEYLEWAKTNTAEAAD